MRLHSATILRALSPVVLCCFVSACGSSGADPANGSGGGALGTCAIRADVTGGTTIHFTGDNDAVCLTTQSSGAGLDGSFIRTDGKGTLEVIVDDLAEGQTGSDFPTRIVVTSTARENWQGASCLTSISEHRLVRTEASTIGELRHYQVSGAGTCTGVIESVPAGRDGVTLSPFSFRAEFTWPD